MGFNIKYNSDICRDIKLLPAVYTRYNQFRNNLKIKIKMFKYIINLTIRKYN
jgi:hypothetical protein